jgi:hypothetical protein
MPAFLLNPLIRYGLIALVIGVLLGLWRWERHDRIAAEKEAAAALERLDLAQQDAARWQQAATLRDAAIAELKTTLETQSAAAERWRLSSEKADAAARVAAETDQRNRAAADARIRELMEAARARPEAVRPLGPLVLGRVDGLFN